MNGAPDPLLNELSDAITSREFQRAQDIANELQQEYESRRDEERDRVNNSRALYADRESVSIENVAELSGIIRIDGGTRMLRSLLFLTIGMLVESHEELSDAGELDRVTNTAETAIAELQSAEQELANASETVDELVEQSDVPPTLKIQSTSIETGTTDPRDDVTVTITVANTGDRSANSVEISFRQSENITVSETALTVGELQSGQSVTEETTVSGSVVGSHAINVQVTGQDATTDQSTIVLSIEDQTDNPAGDGGEDSQSDTGSADDDSADNSELDDQSTTDTNSDDGGALGVIVGGTAATLGGIGYLLKRRVTSADDDTETQGPWQD